ncbi:hypothetical protein [Brevibacillus sp. NL20B1]|uniref:hypothetical protein n=1 Tax=Brevibacillus sp. NL20B1 TaxID=2829799 RepID=UPI001B912E63|nr:hypothetical protein [Brevibacillus sp. NL20B1]MBR8661150.1 hypothetical protein [Brevibacillus sp. NL20B1]
MSNANVTVLTDENGVLREYREVRRKANVGERIKVIDDRKRGDHDFELGEILYVIHDNRWPNSNPNGGVSVSEHFQKARSKFEGRGIYNDRYVVLEPTDVVIIDGVRYREERRKARVGERVLITHGDDRRPDLYKVGDIGTVTGEDEDDGYGPKVKFSDGKEWWVGHRNGKSKCVVITPISETHTNALADLQSEIASLKRRVAELEARLTPATISVSIPQVTVNGTVDDVAQAVADAVKCELTKMSAQEFVSHAEELLGLTKSPQQLRDEIVERAKRDVVGLAKPHWNGSGDLVYAIHPFLYTAEFVVNRDKRTVVCLLRQYSRNNGHPVERRGIAKCAPDDCFNVHIGKAIALRRALGLSVPNEYLNAPQPTEVRVGDVVNGSGLFGAYTPDKTFTITADRGDNSFKYAERPSDWIYRHQIGRIIDDSREETEVFA